MRILSNTLVLAIGLLGQLTANLFAQDSGADANSEISVEQFDYTSKDPYWFIGLGWNIVDDDGSEVASFSDLFDNYNMVPYPSRLNIGREFRGGLGVQLALSYNRYKEGTVIDKVVIPETLPYYAADVYLTYDLNEAIGQTGIFDPYIGLGTGITHVSDETSPFGNALLGLRLWLGESWGVDLSTAGKFSMNSKSTNHFQHSFGVIFRLKEKEKEKEPLSQKATTLESEVAGVVYKVEKPVAEMDSTARGSSSIELTAVGEGFPPLPLQRVHFGFDSSDLDVASSGALDELVDYLKANDSAALRLRAHTDSRGPAEYNQLLSERRLKSVLIFLQSRGIDTNGWDAKGMGETEPLIPCDTPQGCTTDEHARNRRVEFGLNE